ncbi:uncharacterized protein [Medicago truncatula]|uniref:uncharacterized protein n=1 Tax=Medicago truncatula TaxID=3880 RepID=UPI000D2F1678|nr:uncharacterized protein LOC112420125 [Medicago truncatula]
MWDKSLIDVCSSMSFAHVIVVSGRVILTGEDVVVVNVYAPCEQIAKRDLWDRFLIPKVNSLQRFNDFHPISTVGYMYKVLAKVLVNRLRAVMGSVVSDSQSAFVKGKQILDGILIANETVDEARHLKKELILFKVDFEKAYDSVDLIILIM